MVVLAIYSSERKNELIINISCHAFKKDHNETGEKDCSSVAAIRLPPKIPVVDPEKSVS